MGIRRAKITDGMVIKDLLEQLGYPNTQDFLVRKMKAIQQNGNAELIVYEMEGKVVALMAIDFITQLALEGDFTRISYFVVDAAVRNTGIGEEMENFCTRWAMEKGCDRIEVHCSDRRVGAHQFYGKCGYSESPKYFIKQLRYEYA
jgi:N-acetylglutamate synthase-like GNAT family acetyltransferase